jgi:hypothetical protein
MKKTIQKILAFIVLLLLNSQFLVFNVEAKKEVATYTTYRSVDKNTFNEFRYKITKQFFRLKEKWMVDNVLDSAILLTMKNLVNTSFKYLPSDDLTNENYKNNFIISINQALKHPNSEAAYV